MNGGLPQASGWAAINAPAPGTSGYVGAFFNEANMGAADFNAAAALWQAWTGVAVQATRFYLAASNFSYGSDLAEMVTAGVKINLTIRPAYNPVSATDLANMTDDAARHAELERR